MSRCLRHVFVSFNFLFWIFGVVLMGLGFFAEFDPAFVHRLVTFVDGIEETFTEDNNNNNNGADATVSPAAAAADLADVLTKWSASLAETSPSSAAPC